MRGRTGSWGRCLCVLGFTALGVLAQVQATASAATWPEGGKAGAKKLDFDLETLDISPRVVYTLVLADLQSDGDLDIVSPSANTDEDLFNYHPVYAYLNDGTGRYKDATRKMIPPSAATQDSFLPATVVADLNHDGRDDIFFGQTQADRPDIDGVQGLVLYQNKNGKTKDVTGRVLPGIGGNFPFSMPVADIDGDGDLDVLRQNNCCIMNPRASHFLLNDGKGVFTVDETRIPAELLMPTTPHFGSVLVDVDDDADADLVFGATPDGPMMLLYNDGAGFFTAAPEGSVPDKVGSGRRRTEMLALADTDADGRDDVVALVVESDTCDGCPSGSEKDTFQILVNRGDGTFENGPRVPQARRPNAGARGWTMMVAAGDLNNDGLPDLVGGHCCGMDTFPRVFLNRGGKKSFKEVKKLLEELGPYFFQPQLGDIDNDGDLDIVAAGGDRIFILRNRLIR